MPKLALIIFAFFSFCFAEDFSRTIPKDYQTVSQYLSKPTDDIYKRDCKYDDYDDFIFLHKETVQFVDSKGITHRIRRNIYRALNDAGVKSLSERQYYFTDKLDKVFLIKAETRQENGLTQEIKQDAAFVKSSGDQEDLYGDEKSLHMIFPNVKKGSIVEYIVYEQSQPLVPNSFFKTLYLDSYFPNAFIKHTLVLPTALAKTLSIHNTATPIKAEISQKDNLKIYTWIMKQVPALIWERGQAPRSQVGPIVTLSTWTSWQNFHDWYHPLLEERSQIDQKLKDELKELTKGLKSKKDIIAKIYQKVSTKIRYTGLEFGIAGYQPHDCKEVWENKYGDCKDKSNLLRVLLAEYGIKSYLCLLNTDRKARIFKESPSYGQFDHAILAIEDGDSYLFCDPTIPYSQVGALGTGSQEKDVLLVKEDKIEFSKTPKLGIGKFTYNFDIEQNENAEIKGWFTFKTNKYRAAIYRDYYLNQSLDVRQEKFKGVVNSFFPGAELIDSKIQETDLGTFTYKVYFKQAGTKGAHSFFVQLSDGEYVLPFLNQESTRKKNFFQGFEDNEINFTYKFPETWGTKHKPQNFDIKNDYLTLSGHWREENGQYKATIKYQTSKREFLAQEYEILKKSVESFRVWLQKPVEIIPGVKKGNALSPQKEKTELEGFEILLTAEGQMNLINELYERKSFPKKRKLALEKMISWFPNDETHNFQAQIELALLLEVDKQYLEAAKLYEAALKKYKNMKDRSFYSWGEYSYAYTLNQLGKKQESIDLLLKVSRDKDTSLYRRSWSYSRAAEYCKENKERLVILEESITIKGPAYQNCYEYLISTLAREKQQEKLNKSFAALSNENNEFQTKILNELLDYPEWYLKNGETEAAITLSNTLTRVVKKDFSKLSLDLKSFDKALAQLETIKSFSKVQEGLKNLIKTEAFSWWDKTELKKFKSYYEARKFAKKLEDDSLSYLYIKAKIHCLIAYPPRLQDFSKIYFHAVQGLYNFKPSNKALVPLISLANALNQDDDFYREIRFILADLHNDNNRYEETVKIYDELLKSPMEYDYEITTRGFRGDTLIKLNRYKEALVDYKAIEGIIEEDIVTGAWNFMIKAIYINLELGQVDEAKRIIQALSEISAKDRKAMDFHMAANNLCKMLKTSELDRWIEKSKQWWPRWEILRNKFDLKVNTYTDYIPVETINLRVKKHTLNSFNRTLSLNRWHPTVGTLLHKEIDAVVKLAPSLKNELYQICSEILNVPRGINTINESSYLVHRFIFLRLLNDYKLIKELSTEHFKIADYTTVSDQAVLRLWALEAVDAKQDLAFLTKELERMFQEQKTVFDRAISCYVLSELYRVQNMPQKEINFLAKENTKLSAEPQSRYTKFCQTRYKELIENQKSTETYLKALTELLSKYEPQWLKYVENPFDDLQQAVDSIDDLNRSQAMKVHSLAIKHPSFSNENKVEYFENLVSSLYDQQLSLSDKEKFLNEVLKIKSLPKEVKSHLVWIDIYEHYLRRNYQAFLRACSNPFYNPNDYQKDWTKRVSQYLFAHKSGAKELASYLNHFIQKKTISEHELHLAEHAIKDLGYTGQVQQAIVFCQKAQKLSILKGEDLTIFSLKLKMKRLKKYIETHCQTYVKAKEIVATIINEKTAPFDSNFIFLYDRDEYLDKETLLNLELATVQKNLPEYSSMNSIIHLAYHHPKSNAEIKTKLSKHLLKNSLSDKRLKRIIYAHQFAITEDTLEESEQLLKLLLPYKNSKYKDSKALIELQEIECRLARGEKISFKKDYQNLEDSNYTNSLQRDRIHYYILHNKPEKLTELLDTLSEDQLMNKYNLCYVLKGFEYLQREEECELIKEYTNEEFKKELIDEWSYFNTFIVFRNIKRLKYLNTENIELLKVTIKDLLNKSQNKSRILYLNLYLALIEKRWTELLKLTENSSSVDDKWYRALAYYQTNNFQKAEQELQEFLKESQDNFFATDAKKLLKTIKEKKLSLN